MPYVNEQRAAELSGGQLALTSGDLAFLLADQIGRYLVTHDLRWDTISDVIGALDGVKFEFQRRVQTPYEQTKLENGGADPFTARCGNHRFDLYDIIAD